jgi:hypothetical protein
MRNNGYLWERAPGARSSPRVQTLREIAISYEGQDEQIVVKPPNLSRRGMFINTQRSFPEGAVLNLRFGLVLTNAEIQTRCEVRYCQPGVGVGVEFIGLEPEALKMIEQEIALNHGEFARPTPCRRAKKKLSLNTKKRVR